MRDLYFFIGTEAEIMKMFIVIKKARSAGFRCRVIASGQNDVTNSSFMKLCDSQVDIDFSCYMPKNKSGTSYLNWFNKTTRYGIKYMKKVASKCNEHNKPVMVVHGDTLSTLMGAMIAKKAGMPHVHVEGGLRSYNWLNPFPEEIDRYFASKYAELVFCPNEEATLLAMKNSKGEAVNTKYNTNIETLEYAYQVIAESAIKRVYEEQYFVSAIHRQENLMSRKFMKSMVKSILVLSERIHCLFICHQQTEDTLKKYRLMENIKNNSNITVVKRLDYFQFIDVVDKAEFLVADGAGNQQEMYYMGKPYLIMRGKIENDSEGLGYNCVGFHNDFKMVERFDKEYVKYKRRRIKPEVLPSDIIVSKLVEKYSI